MSCQTLTLKGLANNCDKSMGGVSKVWIANYGTFSPTYAETSGVTESDTIATEITGGTTTGFHYYYFKKNTASMTSTSTIDAANGVNFVTTELNMVFSRMDTAKRLEIAALTVNDCECIVKDANGRYWFLGNDNPVNATTATGNTGTQKTDGNNYQITLSDESNEFPYEITSASLIAEIEAL